MTLEVRNNQKLSVIVIDDESDIRETLRMFLEMMGIFTFIVEANDGQEAFMKIQNQNFDLIITDLMMPKVKGIELIENVKNHEKRKGAQETPIIILSANITGENVTRAMEMGVKYALTKPCRTEDFTSKVEEVLLKHKKDKVKMAEAS